MNYFSVHRAVLFTFVFVSLSVHAQVNRVKKETEIYAVPDLLTCGNGTKIAHSKEWKRLRRPEIIRLFEQYEYGRIPDAQIRTRFKPGRSVANALNGKARLKEIVVSLSNGKDSVEMSLLILLPVGMTKPAPVFFGMNFGGNQTIHTDTNITAALSLKSRGSDTASWPIERILERGYGVATAWYGDIDPDFDDGFQNGIHPLFYRINQRRPAPGEWGSIGAWAYGLSRAMDYLVSDADIDPNRVALFGHSRLGKTALWAGALDERFSIVISNNSGCCGAGLFRRKEKQTIKDITTKFPYWFCGTFRQFCDKEDSLRIDQHMLIALIAPRAVYVASAKEDKWADAHGEYLSLYYAAPVFGLFGIEILKSQNLPALNRPIVSGTIGYHIRSGDHGITRYDWEQYLDFADIQFR